MLQVKMLLKTLKAIFSYKIYAWVLFVLILLLGGVYIKGTLNQGSQKVEVSSTVQYLEKVDETVFLNVGIQKVAKLTEDSKLFGKKIPFSEKTALIILNYKAKLGIKQSVRIEKTGDREYTVILPEFEVIGFEWDAQKGYELYDKDGGFLSIGTKDVDTGKAVAEETTSKKQKQYIKQYSAELKESAEEYYKNLFHSINPDLVVTVKYP